MILGIGIGAGALALLYGLAVQIRLGQQINRRLQSCEGGIAMLQKRIIDCERDEVARGTRLRS